MLSMSFPVAGAMLWCLSCFSACCAFECGRCFWHLLYLEEHSSTPPHQPALSSPHIVFNVVYCAVRHKGLLKHSCITYKHMLPLIPLLSWPTGISLYPLLLDAHFYAPIHREIALKAGFRGASKAAIKNLLTACVLA